MRKMVEKTEAYRISENFVTALYGYQYPSRRSYHDCDKYPLVAIEQGYTPETMMCGWDFQVIDDKYCAVYSSSEKMKPIIEELSKRDNLERYIKRECEDEVGLSYLLTSCIVYRYDINPYKIEAKRTLEKAKARMLDYFKQVLQSENPSIEEVLSIAFRFSQGDSIRKALRKADVIKKLYLYEEDCEVEYLYKNRELYIVGKRDITFPLRTLSPNVEKCYYRPFKKNE